jgi:aquaporin NIP
VLITFILLIVVMATATDERAESPAVGLGVGLTIAAGILVAGPVSGASFNPARSLAPMIVTGQFPAWAVYVVGPLAGALAGAFLYEFLLRPGEPPEPAGAVEEHERGEF